MNAKTVSWLCEKKSDSDVMMGTWSTYLIFKFCGCLISVECKIEFNLNVTFFYYWSKTWNSKWSSFIDGLKLGTRFKRNCNFSLKKGRFQEICGGHQMYIFWNYFWKFNFLITSLYHYNYQLLLGQSMLYI